MCWRLHQWSACCTTGRTERSCFKGHQHYINIAITTAKHEPFCCHNKLVSCPMSMPCRTSERVWLYRTGHIILVAPEGAWQRALDRVACIPRTCSASGARTISNSKQRCGGCPSGKIKQRSWWRSTVARVIVLCNRRSGTSRRLSARSDGCGKCKSS